MQVVVATLTGACITLDLTRKQCTLAGVRARLAAEWRVPAAGQVLVHSGRVLPGPDTDDLSRLGVRSGDQIVLYFSHRQYRTTSRSVHERLRGVTRSTTTTRTTTTTPHHDGHPASSPRMATVVRAWDTATSSSRPDRDSAFAARSSADHPAQQALVVCDEVKVQRLLEMGFRSATEIRSALVATRNNIDLALNWLITRNGDPAEYRRDR
ncbi:unnamed protein product (mitochondrion) [Plasmodiophora brassicae]|uniref:UBA domain-containing protein n=1 Tax=Plasmodiophora brassicae TaxID=37360 RepID=A0A0G4IMC7_PLABS|nr:hypothetical protein PBRA_004923 [Plasmodiophora brassicae]SPQ99186.1 unnamed protein product [Plasmodiophora brassicae]